MLEGADGRCDIDPIVCPHVCAPAAPGRLPGGDHCGVREQNAVLAQTAQMVATTAKEVAAMHTEASRQAAADIRVLEALADHLHLHEEE